MHTITIRSTIDEQGHLRLDVPSGLPPRPVEVLLLLQPPAGALHQSATGTSPAE